ncbi:PilN domain-containing protein [Fontibacillus sp. BL9]|uniref:PilN domain-containing protein n=1 Tax=Fontibacillus sp. BL9 TaxID=3389971 RepID=UPI00397937FF
MIEINLLPPRQRPAWTRLLMPLAFIVIGLGLAVYLTMDYLDVLQSADDSRQNIETAQQRQTELQEEIQRLSQSQGLSGEAAEWIDLLLTLRPDFSSMLSEMENPLPAGGQLQTVQYGGGVLEWTCSFKTLSEAAAYSLAIQRNSGEGSVLIHSVTQKLGMYVGKFQFQLVNLDPVGEAGDEG